MPTLRLTQTYDGGPPYRVEIALEGDGQPRRTAIARFAFELPAQDQEDLRWYLEDYLQHPFEPAPAIAARVERRMAEIGTQLFRAVLQSGDDTRDLWATLRDRLNETRIEVVTDILEAATIPWELLRDPTSDVPVALSAASFVRGHPGPALRPRLPDGGAGPIRILLVICRPGGRNDVPFRSVATRVIQGLSEREDFQLDVLRPPTFERLGQVLRQAWTEGRPYHVVHFDGHGVFRDLRRLFEAWKEKANEEVARLLAELASFDPNRFSPQAIYPREPRRGGRGYLAFESPASAHNLRLVDGPELAALLVGAGVLVLVLNACRSAHAEPLAAPLDADRAEGAGEMDPHARVRAFGSLAQEVMDAGAAGVVAMGYNAYVATAARFVADLYAALARGRALGEAATLGRKQLHAQPQREIGYDPRPLQDWSVPVVFEAAPVVLFAEPDCVAGEAPELHLATLAPARGAPEPDLPPQPDIGFFGRDETLLALDRAFDTQSIVLLHGFAGCGKTATAVEFARWYGLTGGLKGPGDLRGPVLFTSFEHHRSLARVLDAVGRAFGAILERRGVHWPALNDEARQKVALQILRQVPVLWIWDNVEPVAGFPAGTPSAWSGGEQRELADFLRAARETRAKFLLTSRREERAWLDDLPAPVPMPPMPKLEQVQMARALAAKRGRRLAEVQHWLPLLRFTQGNPLTIQVVVGQALRDQLATKEHIEEFVAKLRAGEAALEDDQTEGRSRSLASSLSYGFEHAFDEAERRQLALLHLFQGFVDVKVLCVMGDAQAEWCLPELRGLTREAGMALLDRAAEVGLLTALAGGSYAVHPALPWYFRELFDVYYPSDEQRSALGGPPRNGGSRSAAVRGFAAAVGDLGTYYFGLYEEGQREVAAALVAEEANLRHCLKLAQANGWWSSTVGAVQGLSVLYDHMGRATDLGWMLGEVAPNFVDPAADGPLPGREDGWDIVTQYRGRLALSSRQWQDAERLERLRLDRARREAAAALRLPPERLQHVERSAVRTLAGCLLALGTILQEQGLRGCLGLYGEAGQLCQQIGDAQAGAVAAYSMGRAYLVVRDCRDLAQAERWFGRSLELHRESDHLGRSRCLMGLGYVALERFREARAAGRPAAELAGHRIAARQLMQQALDTLPRDAVMDLWAAHSSLAMVCHTAGDIERALPHYYEGIRYCEVTGDLLKAAQTRANVARALARAGHFPNALLYARAAARSYEGYGDLAAAEIQRTRELILAIERDLKTQGG